MKNKTVLIILAILLILPSCIKERYDMDKLSGETALSPTVVLRVVKAEMSLDDLVEPDDTTIVFDEDGLVKLVFKEDSIIDLRLADFYEEFNLFSYDETHQIFDGMETDGDQTLIIEPGEDRKLKKMSISSGELDYTLRSWCTFDVEVELTVPGMVDGSDPLVLSETIPAGSSINSSIDLSAYLASFDASIFLAIMYLPVIAGIAFKLFTSYQHSEKKNILLLQQKTEAELKFLKSQIHPHFLFNTLNNLYAQTLEKSDQAPETVLQLSELLSYILYEGNQKRVKLGRKLEQMNNFIELEKLRYHDRVQIRLDIQPGIGNLEVIPLLFLPLLENAFKHGVKPNPGLSEIELKVFRKDKQLNIICKNTVPQKSKDHQIGGIGLENLEQRLKLSYRENYKLVVELKEGYFTVKIVLW